MSRFTFVMFLVIFLAYWSPSSQQTVSGIPSAAEQQIIVDKHNALRRLVASGNELRGHPGPQKPATNMRQVKWDADLANAALYKTKLCQRTSIPTGSAGPWKNSYKVNYDLGVIITDWNGAIQGWYDEVQYFNNAEAAVLGVTGVRLTPEYVNMMISSMYLVGCSYNTSCASKPLHICAYGPFPSPAPTGLYQVGSTASACPIGTQKNNGLCA